jgi:hypothetical protein
MVFSCRMIGTGASGEILSMLPKTETSSIASPMTTIGVPAAIHGLSLGANEAVDLDERSFAGTPVGTLASCSRSDSILSP